MSKNLFTGQCPSIPSLDGLLICPIVSCGCEYVHLADCRTDRVERGSAIFIEMFCESGHAWTYCIRFHKGTTLVEVHDAREDRPQKEMWRD